MTPLKGRGCTSPSFSVQICRACLAILALNISFCLRTLRGYQLRISQAQLNSGVWKSFKKQEMAENLVFGALPLVLGVPNFPKLV